MGDAATAARCTELREKVGAAIERDFWQEERGEYVWRIEPDLTVRSGEPAHTYVMLEMAALDGSDPRLNGLFDTIEGPEHTGPKGVIHPGTTDFVMPIQNAILALAELQYGRPDKGLWYLERMADLCGYGMPGAIPEFEAKQGTAKACFLQLWSSAAFNRLMVQGWFRLLPDPQQGIVWVRPQLPTGWEGAQVRNLTIWGRRFNLSLQRRGNSIALDVEVLSGDGAHPFRVDTQPALPAVFV
jgi:glycogen debranching enzyme